MNLNHVHNLFRHQPTTTTTTTTTTSTTSSATISGSAAYERACTMDHLDVTEEISPACNQPLLCIQDLIVTDQDFAPQHPSSNIMSSQWGNSSTEDTDLIITEDGLSNGTCEVETMVALYCPGDSGDVTPEGDRLALGNNGVSEFSNSDFSLPEVCISTNSNSFEEDMNYEIHQAYRIFTGFLSDKHKGITSPFLRAVGHQEVQHGIEGVRCGQAQLTPSVCLQGMKEKFINRDYETITEFVADFRLMLENCYRYHGVDHWISKQAQKLEIMLEQKLTLLSRALREKTTLTVTSKGRFGAEEERGSGGTSTRRRLAPRSLATITVGGHESIMVQALRLEEQQRAKEEKRQRELEKKEAEEMSAKEVEEWEQTLLTQASPHTVDTLWELPAIGHFLCLAQTALNLPEIVFFDLERCLLMPRCSIFLCKIMSSLLCLPQRRANLQRRPVLPYRRWESELRQRVVGWYRAVGASHDQSARAEQLGLCHQFFRALGEVSPLEEKPFHLLPLYQRVWLLKGLCDHVYETQKYVQDALLAQPIHECRESILGYDGKENCYIHFPHFCGADLRIYCQSLGTPVFPFPSVRVKRVDIEPGTGGQATQLSSESSQNSSEERVTDKISTKKKKRKKREREQPTRVKGKGDQLQSVDGMTPSSAETTKSGVRRVAKTIKGKDKKKKHKTGSTREFVAESAGAGTVNSKPPNHIEQPLVGTEKQVSLLQTSQTGSTDIMSTPDSGPQSKSEVTPSNRSKDSDSARVTTQASLSPRSPILHPTTGLPKGYTPIPTLLAKSVGNKVTLMKWPADFTGINIIDRQSKGSLVSLPTSTVTTTKRLKAQSFPSSSQQNSQQMQAQGRQQQTEVLRQPGMAAALPKAPQTKPTQTATTTPVQVVYKVPEGLGHLVRKDGSSPVKISVHPVVDHNTREKIMQQLVILPSNLLIHKAEEKVPPLHQQSRVIPAPVSKEAGPFCMSTNVPGFAISESRIPVQQVAPLKGVRTPFSSVSPRLQQRALNAAALKGAPACSPQARTPQGVTPKPSPITAPSSAVPTEPLPSPDPKQELKTMCIRDSQSILTPPRTLPAVAGISLGQSQMPVSSLLKSHAKLITPVLAAVTAATSTTTVGSTAKQAMATGVSRQLLTTSLSSQTLKMGSCTGQPAVGSEALSKVKNLALPSGVQMQLSGKTTTIGQTIGALSRSPSKNTPLSTSDTGRPPATTTGLVPLTSSNTITSCSAQLASSSSLTPSCQLQGVPSFPVLSQPGPSTSAAAMLPAGNVVKKVLCTPSSRLSSNSLVQAASCTGRSLRIAAGRYAHSGLIPATVGQCTRPRFPRRNVCPCSRLSPDYNQVSCWYAHANCFFIHHIACSSTPLIQIVSAAILPVGFIQPISCCPAQPRHATPLNGSSCVSSTSGPADGFNDEPWPRRTAPADGGCSRSPDQRSITGFSTYGNSSRQYISQKNDACSHATSDAVPAAQDKKSSQDHHQQKDAHGPVVQKLTGTRKHNLQRLINSRPIRPVGGDALPIPAGMFAVRQKKAPQSPRRGSPPLCKPVLGGAV
ncbi:hypothetical protein EYF80_008538 [Liparis tanakae]|uniref:Bromo domain-containing protein n=1 Tax=Liparis tanakae TaxID=230148 RepID=A0A4Z2IUK6_9TELE|nr:hypothetical protein EYF80_008538 [Liparis tanakae]